MLDASALLAFLANEAGADVVEAALAAGGAVMHTVNWAEVLTKRAERGDDPAILEAAFIQSGLVHQLLAIDPGQPEDAVRVAALRMGTRPAGLSLGDRYCLALGVRLGIPVLTADRAWRGLAIGVQIDLIR